MASTTSLNDFKAGCLSVAFQSASDLRMSVGKPRSISSSTIRLACHKRSYHTVCQAHRPHVTSDTQQPCKFPFLAKIKMLNASNRFWIRRDLISGFINPYNERVVEMKMSALSFLWLLVALASCIRSRSTIRCLRQRQDSCPCQTDAWSKSPPTWRTQRNKNYLHRNLLYAHFRENSDGCI